MNNQTFDISLRMRLGLPVFNRVAPYSPCYKKWTLITSLVLTLLCALGKEPLYTIRHDGVVAQLGSTLSEARVIHELPNPQGSRNGILADGEPADVWISHITSDPPWAINVTVIDPTNTSLSL